LAAHGGATQSARFGPLPWWRRPLDTRAHRPAGHGQLYLLGLVLEALHTCLVTSAGKNAALLGKEWHSHKGDGRDWVLGEDAGPRFLEWMTSFLDVSTSRPVDGSVVVV